MVALRGVAAQPCAGHHHRSYERTVAVEHGGAPAAFTFDADVIGFAVAVETGFVPRLGYEPDHPRATGHPHVLWGLGAEAPEPQHAVDEIGLEGADLRLPSREGHVGLGDRRPVEVEVDEVVVGERARDPAVFVVDDRRALGVEGLEVVVPHPGHRGEVATQLITHWGWVRRRTGWTRCRSPWRLPRPVDRVLRGTPGRVPS